MSLCDRCALRCRPAAIKGLLSLDIDRSRAASRAREQTSKKKPAAAPKVMLLSKLKAPLELEVGMAVGRVGSGSHTGAGTLLGWVSSEGKTHGETGGLSREGP